MAVTAGTLCFYGGIAGIVLFLTLFITSFVFFDKKKRRLRREIEQHNQRTI